MILMKSRFSLCVILQILFCVHIRAHGMMLEPVGRASRWRLNVTAPINYEDNELFCGGFGIQHRENKGKCGICGDRYDDIVPRSHELGGKFGEGIIVRGYNESTINIGSFIHVNHLGNYFLEICNIDKYKIESEDCFAQYGKLKLPDQSYKLNIGTRKGFINTTVLIPSGLKCQHCVLRWTYTAGNNWGICEDFSEAIGCGEQENYKSCADISIV